MGRTARTKVHFERVDDIGEVEVSRSDIVQGGLSIRSFRGFGRFGKDRHLSPKCDSAIVNQPIPKAAEVFKVIEASLDVGSSAGLEL